MNYTNLTALAAAVAASANTNASAGIGALNLFNHNNNNSSTTTSNSSAASNINASTTLTSNLNDFNKRIICINKTSEITLHQIGTNLVDLTVCWHKMNDNCNKCNEPIYRANQFYCEKCNDEFKMNSSMTYTGALETSQSEANNLYEEAENLTLRTVLTDIDTSSLIKDEFFESAELTRKSFEEEFATLIINSTRGKSLETAVNNLFTSKPKDLITSDTIANFTFKDLIEQINLYNKYNIAKLNDLKYELDDKNDLKIIGLLKIYWNLKNPIKLAVSVEDQKTPNEITNDTDGYTTFKATSIKDLNEKKKSQLSWDDSSIKRFEEKTQINRAQTVKYKPNKSTRPSILKESPKQETTDQMFIPAYASVSSINIDNKTTCLKAIEVLLDKFHIKDSPSKFSLYKVYKNGETRELEDKDYPLMQRLWMGPWLNEDKLFIMEKGRQLVLNQELTNLICLPDAVLRGLLENLNIEIAKETNHIKKRYEAYENYLRRNLSALDENFILN